MSDQIILRVATKIIVPSILLYALYVQFHGDFGPGGGFQAGVIAAASFILYALVFGLRRTQRVLPSWVARACASTLRSPTTEMPSNTSRHCPLARTLSPPSTSGRFTSWSSPT